MKGNITNTAMRVLRWLTLSVTISFLTPPASAMMNPAAGYCKSLGYDYFVAKTKKGERGFCRLPDNREVSARDFLDGKVGLEWSYCYVQGYGAKHVDKSEICNNCTICILADGKEMEVTKLMGLDFREGRCGDGICVTGENHVECPKDCPSGGLDDYCDGKRDSLCDTDCNVFGQEDPDCPDIDIKPGSCPNPLNLKSKGVLPVAVLGTASFDVKENFDPNTIKIYREGINKGVSPLQYKFEDVSTPYAGEPCGCWTAKGDGITDLTLKFDVQEIIQALGLVDFAGQTVSLTISGRLKNNTSYSGKDCIKILELK